MKIDWRKIILPTIVIAALVCFYFLFGIDLLSRPDLPDKTKTLIMLIPVAVACVIIGIIMNREE